MKQFFKFFFASMLGFIIGSLLLVFILVGIVSGVVATISKPAETRVKANSVLVLDLAYDIPEKTDYNPFRHISFSNFEPSVELGLNDILKNIEKAKSDSSIKGIYINSGWFSSGTATAQQIRNALLDFKESKKFILAYGVVFSQKGYYVASVADKVFLNPSGVVEFKGLGARIMFFKGLLEKLGVEVQVFYDGKFKTATEPFRYDKMSEPNKEMTLSLLNDIQNQYLENIAASRNMSVAKLDSIADNLLVRDARAAKEYGMVDELFFDDQVKQFISDKLGLGKKDKINFVTLNKYNQTPDKKKKSLDQAKIAVLYADGDIVDGKGDEDNIGSDRFLKELSKLRKDEKIKAVVLRVNSPGGSALASDIIWREVVLMKAEKPIVVSMGDYAASGGYFISCPASKIVAQSNTLTGSIGVFGLLPNMQKFFNDKLGLTFDGVGTGRFSDFGNLTRPLTAEESAFIQQEVDSIYFNFKKKVAEGRNLSMDSVEAIAQGRVWTGSQALKLGLVDTLGGLNDAIKIAARIAKLSDYRVVEYPEAEGNFAKIFQAISNESEQASMKAQLGEYYPVFKKLQQLIGMRGLQTRMPFEYDIN